MKKHNSDGLETKDNARFQLRSGTAPDAEILSTHATREEADDALKSKREEIATKHAEIIAPLPVPVIVDMGVRTAPGPEVAAVEAKKTAEEKEADRARREPTATAMR